MFRRKRGGTEKAWRPSPTTRGLMDLLGIEAGRPEDVRGALWEEARPRPSGASPEDFLPAREPSPVPDVAEPARRAIGATYGPRGVPEEETVDPWALLRDRKLRVRDERRRRAVVGVFR